MSCHYLKLFFLASSCIHLGCVKLLTNQLFFTIIADRIALVIFKKMKLDILFEKLYFKGWFENSLYSIKG